MENKTLISIKNLKKHFFMKNKKILKAVDGIDIDILKGETLGLVGESGSGKSTIAKMLFNLTSPTSGDIFFEDRSIFDKHIKLHKKMQMVFQDPYSSLNPTMTIEEIIAEPLKIHKKLSKNEMSHQVENLLEKVKLSKNIKNRFPHEFSGGQRQRIAIAKALSLNPSFIVCDEILSSLDVSIQAEIINLLLDLKKKCNFTFLFISHDLAVVKYISDKIAVMYLGKFLEVGLTKDVFLSPKHPYTKALIASNFAIENKEKSNLIKGEMPSLLEPIKGCLFASRCIIAKKMCFEIEPSLEEKTKNHLAACHFVKASSKSSEGSLKTTFSSL